MEPIINQAQCAILYQGVPTQQKNCNEISVIHFITYLLSKTQTLSYLGYVLKKAIQTAIKVATAYEDRRKFIFYLFLD